MALRRVFTYLGAVFLMSYIIFSNNASAISTNISFDDIIVKGSSLTPTVECSINGSNASVQYSWCYSKSTDNVLNSIHTTDYFDVEKGDYIEFDLVIRTNSNLAITDGYYLEDVNNYAPSGFRLVNREQIINTTLYSNMFSVSNGTGGSTTNDNYIFHAYRYVFRYVGNGSSVQIGLNQQSPGRGFIHYNGQFFFRLANVVVYEGVTSSQSQDQKNEIESTNNAAQDSETQGNSSQSDAQTGTASLVSTIGSAVSAITSASPTNCLLNGNMGNFDMGQIDLCANAVPPFVQIISSLILILITVPLCIVLFNRFIGLFRSFQG